MAKTVNGFLTCLVLFLLMASVVSADGSYRLVYQEQIPGAKDYVYLDPVVGLYGSWDGMLVSDAASNSVIFLSREYGERALEIDCEGVPYRTINFHRGDTLVVYGVKYKWNYRGRLFCYREFDGQRDETVYPLPVPAYGVGGVQCTFCDLSFGLREGRRPAVIFSHILHESRADALELTSRFHNWAGVFDLNLEPEVTDINATLLRSGHLLPNDDLGWAACQQALHRQRSDFGSIAVEDLDVWISSSPDRDLRAANSTPLGTCHQILVDRFLSADTVDAILFSGRGADLLDLRQPASHTALYTFQNGYPEEVWYREGYPAGELHFVYHPRRIVAGLAGDSIFIALDYTTGEVVDSVSLDRQLEIPRFFSAGDGAQALHLIGRSHDTVFVYEFSDPLPSTAPRESTAIPLTFSLHPNQPNPFNGETTISFTNEESQRLTLKIYNLLGQELMTLHDRQTGVGSFQYTWNGLDAAGMEQASGIYFAQLRSDLGSQLIKMIYLK